MAEEHSRESDKVVYQLLQEFRDFEKHTLEWRDGFDTRLVPIEDFVRDFGAVRRIIFGTFAALGTLATLGIAIYRFFRDHWRG